ncbi:hypothetical protein K437DRAFT_260758 [Tilletiaria anomala UBC 951]|uniref:Uncharacterized protein n=1 Tax=Tilletiaria anomala (strain ATCC 24038 / CBS 436.72 / UBC 951) TaxID=1037660 RepID=A0A066WL31_TILAU|nr:uncharacterized protein K437DRAFT_260758 [Tilletiaria anomala UBC 951]KDN53283.1 hypothetical protein K437DRAFT_260758 [Tilletiaria anomala UBC 951]
MKESSRRLRTHAPANWTRAVDSSSVIRHVQFGRREKREGEKSAALLKSWSVTPIPRHLIQGAHCSARPEDASLDHKAQHELVSARDKPRPAPDLLPQSSLFARTTGALTANFWADLYDADYVFFVVGNRIGIASAHAVDASELAQDDRSRAEATLALAVVLIVVISLITPMANILSNFLFKRRDSQFNSMLCRFIITCIEWLLCYATSNQLSWAVSWLFDIVALIFYIRLGRTESRRATLEQEDDVEKRNNSFNAHDTSNNNNNYYAAYNDKLQSFSATAPVKHYAAPALVAQQYAQPHTQQHTPVVPSAAACRADAHHSHVGAGLCAAVLRLKDEPLPQSRRLRQLQAQCVPGAGPIVLLVEQHAPIGCSRLLDG